MDTTHTKPRYNWGYVASIALLTALTLYVPSLVGCGAGQDKDMANLQTSLRGYHNALRMGRYHDASKYLQPSDQAEYIGRYEELGDDFEIVEVEAKVVNIEKEGEIARSETEIKWYRLPNMTVNRDKIVETWERVEGAWLIIDREIEPVKKKKKRAAKSLNEDKRTVRNDTLP